MYASPWVTPSGSMLSEAPSPKATSVFGQLKTATWIDSKALPLIQLALNQSSLKPFFAASRKPPLTPKNFAFHGSNAEFQHAYVKSKKIVIPFGSAQEKQLEKIRGFYDPAADKIHLRPSTSLGLALRLAIHRLTTLAFRVAFGASVADGLSLYFANLVLGEQGRDPIPADQYADQLRCAKNLIALAGTGSVAKAYFGNNVDLVRHLTRNLHTGPITNQEMTQNALCTPRFDYAGFKQRCQNFFKDYELNFLGQHVKYGMFNNKQLSEKVRTERIRDLNLIIGPLRERLKKRAELALASPPAVPAAFPPLTPEERRATANLSTPQFNLFVKWFGGPKGINFAAAQQCFEMFANGELRWPFEPNHKGLFEPDGADLFLFAEFAFLCIDVGERRDFWARILKTFVKTQEIFMHVYRDGPKPLVPPPVNAPFIPRPFPRSMGSFDYRNFRQIGSSVNVGEGQSNTNRKIALRAKYDGMDLNSLKAAARDNLARAQLMP